MEEFNAVFMAFSAGNSSEVKENPFKRYTGIAPVNVIAVNPNKEEFNKIFNSSLEKEPEYYSKDENGVERARIDFIVKTDPANESSKDINITTRISIFLENRAKYNRDKTKIQVINLYGETTWISPEDLENNTLPENQTWFDKTGMRAAYVGETDLTDFLKAYLCIPNISYKDKTGNMVRRTDKSMCEAQLSDIPKYFKGDISEVKSLIKTWPDNQVKCAFGVRTTEDNKQYQVVYTRNFLKNTARNTAYLKSQIEAAQNMGSYPNTTFTYNALEEYVITPTSFKDEISATSTSFDDDLPFSEGPSMDSWFNK